MALVEEKKRLRGAYLVPDPLMMKPQFGPSEHIKAGVKELSKYFDMELLVLGEYKQTKGTNRNSVSSLTKGRAIDNGFVGLLRDLKLYVKSNRGMEPLLQQLKDLRVDFIYERGQYLDLRGVKAAKRLGIMHYYEVNWLNFLGIRQFYRSWFNPVAKIIEERSYKKSRLNFFIGTQHNLISIPPNKVFTIQNGIEEHILNENIDHENVVDGKLRVCFVANLMPHHRFDIFLQALERSGTANKIELHAVGYNFEEFEAKLPSDLQYYLHGPKNKSDLADIIRSCNVGLISGGPSYSSFMKLFEYAAFKLCVVCPDLENVRMMFEENEIRYFKTGDASSLAEQLNLLCSNHKLIGEYGGRIYEKVKQRYTWEKIYHDVACQIESKTRND